MQNYQKRILTALIGVPLILLVLYTGGIPFLLFVIAVLSLSLFEFFRMVNLKDYRSIKILIFVTCVLMSFGAYSCSFLIMTFFTFAVLLFMVILLVKSEPSGLITALGLFTFPVIYFGWFFNHALLIRNITLNPRIHEYASTVQGLNDPGFFFLVLVIACSFLNDTGAYSVGKWIGSVKLAPSISPGKTVEGTAGGIIICVLTAIVVNLIFSSPLSVIWTIIFALLIGISAVSGDLFESSIKRGIGVKDSGSILPGHGGIMDRFDSLFFVFPVAYYLTIIYYFLMGVKFY